MFHLVLTYLDRFSNDGFFRTTFNPFEVCVFVCVKERKTGTERERQAQKERETQRERERERERYINLRIGHL